MDVRGFEARSSRDCPSTASTSSVSEPLTTDASGTSPRSTPRPSLEAAGGLIVLLSLAWLLLDTAGGAHPPLETACRQRLIRGVSSDVVRSAEHYARYGFPADVGLPHTSYGNRFPNDGWLSQSIYISHLEVYTHYPPLPNWIAGLLEVTIGFQHLWLWRIVPITCGFQSDLCLLHSSDGPEFIYVITGAALKRIVAP